MTVIEIIVVSAIAVVILSVLITIQNSNAKMNKAALASVNVQNALIIQETIAADIRQLGVQPQRGALPLLNDTGISFFRCVFQGKEIRFRPVRYGCERTAAGNYRLVRTEVVGGREERTKLEGVINMIRFRLISDPQFGSVYLKVELGLIDDDVPGPARRDALTARVIYHDVLCRIPIPSEVGHPRLQKTCTPVIERDLLPLN